MTSNPHGPLIPWATHIIQSPLQRDAMPKGGWTGAAWLSSVRGLNCSLQWGNERNPCCLLQVSDETAQLREWKVEGGRWKVDIANAVNYSPLSTLYFLPSKLGGRWG